MDLAEVKAAAHGRWTEILAALGVPRGVLDRKNHPCPLGCGGKDRFRYSDYQGHGIYYCRQCGPGDGFTFLQRFHGWEFGKTVREVEATLGMAGPSTWKKRATDPRHRDWLWRSCRALKPNDPVASYLSERSIERLSDALRYAPALPYDETPVRHPAMVAMFSTAEGDHGTLHKTFLADVDPRRKFARGEVPRGGAIRLFPARGVMGVAEGIETALAASILFDMPVWATCSEGCLRRWVPPREATHVHIFGDNDENFVGHAAAWHLAHRLRTEFRLTTVVRMPDRIGSDWNDVLHERDIDEQVRELEHAKEQLASMSVSDADSEA